MVEATWRPGTPVHLRVSVPLEETAEVERVYGRDRAATRVGMGYPPGPATASRGANARNSRPGIGYGVGDGTGYAPG